MKPAAFDYVRAGHLDEVLDVLRREGGDARIIDDPGLLPQAAAKTEVKSSRTGIVSVIQCEVVGTAGVILGGGREKKEDSVDPAVGIVLHKKVGDRVTAGESLCTVHYNSERNLARATQLIEESFRITDTLTGTPRPLVHRVIQNVGKKA